MDVFHSIYIRHNENKELVVLYVHRLLSSKESLSSLQGGTHFNQRIQGIKTRGAILAKKPYLWTPDSWVLYIEFFIIVALLNCLFKKEKKKKGPTGLTYLSGERAFHDNSNLIFSILQ